MWKKINGYERYKINEDGDIISNIYKIPKKLKHRLDRDGYCEVILYNKDGYRNFRIHKLVAEHFIPNPEDLDTVDHIDFDLKNNNIDNLQWLSRSDNSKKKKRGVQIVGN